MTVGSKSSMTALGVCTPEEVYEKNVCAESSLQWFSGLEVCPSGLIPCYRQNSSQQALPTCIPPWPT